MKKLSKFKIQKREASDYLADLPIRFFNRFTKEEIALALNKDVLETSNDVWLLIKWCFDNTKPIKLNLDRHLVNVRLYRTGQKKNQSIDNRVWVEVAPRFSDSRLVEKRCEVKDCPVSNVVVSKARKSFKILAEFRAETVVELAKIGILNNVLCDVFEDSASIQNPILENPKLFLTEEELIEIEKYY